MSVHRFVSFSPLIVKMYAVSGWRVLLPKVASKDIRTQDFYPHSKNIGNANGKKHILKYVELQA